MSKVVRQIVIMFFLVSAPLVFGQSFRGEYIPMEISVTEQAVTTVLSSGQVGVAILPEKRTFLAGIAVRLRPAAGMAAPPVGTYSVAVYNAIDASSGTSGFVTLAGSLVENVPLGGTQTLSLIMSFPQNEAPSVPAGTRVYRDIDPAIGDLGFQIVPISKGIAPDAADTAFELEITPLLRQVGTIEVAITGDEDVVAEARQLLQITVDGRLVQPEQPTEFPPGIYRLEASAGDLLDHTANVGIERARNQKVVLQVERPKATVRLSVPSVAEVFWNGTFIEDRTLSLEPGIHTFLIRLGDFSLSRRLELEAHGNYEVGIDLDILFKQN